ncbi:SOS response-associated peptidase [Methylobacterium organophilum]|uniref:SOS response-associated peptidase n=1 Tax=Methylobacterium organophilum TaxID=410 RepID=UPI001F12BF31|nr:SOS response-associated peptidase [Methylobacterium organophilum]UMY17042.1 SOS response-associated peptidase [Methylobacterium organophilum]
MCGRYVIAQAPETYRAFYGYPERPNFPARYNVAPTQPVPVVTADHGARHIRLVRWGFWPAWLKDPRDFPLVINARVETLREKPTFRGALRHRRCIFLADGFYEWRRDGQGKTAVKTPFAIRRADGAPMALAGLWEPWMGADGSEVDTAAIVTCGANGTLAAIHHRMPAILSPEGVAAWLDTDHVDGGAAAALCRPCPDEWLTLDAVSDRVNSVRNDDPDLLTPVGTPQPEPAKRADAQGPARSSDEDAQGRLF